MGLEKKGWAHTGNRSATPKGTRPQETRRSTRHRTVAFGIELQLKAAERNMRKGADR